MTEKSTNSGGDETGGPHVPMRDQVNRSGFPFQLAVQREIESIPYPFGWELVARELPYSRGFIDLVFRNGGPLIAVLECKRFTEQDWIFLVKQEDTGNVPWCRWTVFQQTMPTPDTTQDTVTCRDLAFGVLSHTSDICMVRGSSGKHTIESMCQELILATREIAHFPGLKHRSNPEYLIPILVTTANLFVCRYDRKKLDLAIGHIDPATAFEPVQFIRFRKTLLTLNDRVADRSLTLEEVAAEQQRTVLVCHGSHIKPLMYNIIQYTNDPEWKRR